MVLLTSRRLSDHLISSANQLALPYPHQRYNGKAIKNHSAIFQTERKEFQNAISLQRFHSDITPYFLRFSDRFKIQNAKK